MVLDICESCIRLENRLTVFWGLGARSGQAQEYSLTAVTGNQKFTPIIHYLHFHFSKAEVNQLQISVKTCRPHSGKKPVQASGIGCIKLKSHNELLSSGIRRERRRYCLSHPPQFYLTHYLSKFPHVQNKNSNFWKKKIKI